MDYAKSGRGIITTQDAPLVGIDFDLDTASVPGYRFLGFLDPASQGVRVLAIRRMDQAHVIFHAAQRCTRSWGIRHRGRDAKKFIDAVTPLRRLQTAHVLPIIDVITNLSGAHWVVTPFIGSSAGITTLTQALEMRDEARLEPQECILAADQLLNAIKAARAINIPHGTVLPADVIVDKHGTLKFELLGIRRALNGATESDELSGSEVWGEVRSIAKLVYRLYTGVDVPAEWIDPERLAPRVERRKADRDICAWLKLVLLREQPLGVDEALAALTLGAPEPSTTVVETIAARAGRSVLRVALGSREIRPATRK